MVGVFTDAELAAFIDGLPSEEELAEELAPLFPERVCAVCGASLVMYRKDARTHSNSCRQKAYRRRLVARQRAS